MRRSANTRAARRGRRKVTKGELKRRKAVAEGRERQADILAAAARGGPAAMAGAMMSGDVVQVMTSDDDPWLVDEGEDDDE